MRKCNDCGGDIATGDWPFCGGDPTKHEPARNFGDEPMEAYWDEHLSTWGEHVTTRGERRRIMAREGLEYKDVSKKQRGKIYVDLGGHHG